MLDELRYSIGQFGINVVDISLNLALRSHEAIQNSNIIMVMIHRSHSQILRVRSIEGALEAEALDLLHGGAMVESVPGPLSGEGGLADGAFDSGPGEGEGFGDGCRRDLAGAEEDDGAAFI